MTDVGYVAVCYLTVIGSVAGFAWYTIRRGRRLSRQLAPEERRWL